RRVLPALAVLLGRRGARCDRRLLLAPTAAAGAPAGLLARRPIAVGGRLGAEIAIGDMDHRRRRSLLGLGRRRSRNCRFLLAAAAAAGAAARLLLRLCGGRLLGLGLGLGLRLDL